MSIHERVHQREFASLAAKAFVALVVTGEFLTQEAGDVCTRHGITGDQYNVLRILRGVHPDGHPRYEIGRRLMRKHPDVTRLLNRLERQELITREAGAVDRRLSIARITETGLALLERLDPEIDALMERTLSPLNSTRCKQLIEACDMVLG